jgi:hypothetical protein
MHSELVWLLTKCFYGFWIAMFALAGLDQLNEMNRATTTGSTTTTQVNIQASAGTIVGPQSPVFTHMLAAVVCSGVSIGLFAFVFGH